MSEATDKDDAIWLSSTQLSMFKQCALKWKFRYIDKLRGESTPAMVTGTFVHSVFEHLYGLPPKERTIDSARVIAREQWNLLTETEEFKAFELTDEDQKPFRVNSWNLIKRLWDLERPQFLNIVGLEQKVSFEITPGVQFVGFIDRLSAASNGLVVSDYKTGKRPWKNYEDDKVEQIMLYALAVSKLQDDRVSKGQLLFLGGSQPGVISRSVTEKALEKTEQKLLADAVEIQAASTSTEWETCVGPLCGWCDFIHLCEDGQSYVQGRLKEGNFREDAPAVVFLRSKEPQ